MTWFFVSIAALLTLAMWTPALAQQSTSRSFFDSAGRYTGSSTTHGDSTTFTDHAGRQTGTSIRRSDSSTSYFNSKGQYVGSTRPR